MLSGTSHEPAAGTHARSICTGGATSEPFPRAGGAARRRRTPTVGHPASLPGAQGTKHARCRGDGRAAGAARAVTGSRERGGVGFRARCRARLARPSPRPGARGPVRRRARLPCGVSVCAASSWMYRLALPGGTASVHLLAHTCTRDELEPASAGQMPIEMRVWSAWD
jgi:hypothetical protein